MALFYVLGYLPFWYAPIYPDYLNGNAWVSSLLLRLLCQETQVTGATIHSPHFAIDIKPGCDALEPAWILISAVLSYPASLSQRLLGIGTGLLVILPLNLVRIGSLFLVGSYVPQFFPAIHLEIWPVVFIMTSVFIFTRWIRWTNAAHAQV